MNQIWQNSQGLQPWGIKQAVRRYLKLIFIFCPLVTGLFVLGFGGADQFLTQFPVSLTISIVVATTCFVCATSILALINAWRRRRNRPEWGSMYGLMASYPFLLPGLFLGFKAGEAVSSILGRVWNAPSFNDYSSGVIFGILISCMFTLFELIRNSKLERQESQLRLQALENDKLKAQVSALTAQMNPHLLFNSLNTIAAVITTQPEAAEEMTIQLSDLYRGILKASRGDVHSLQAEIDLCRSYLEIEKKRFGARIDYHISIDPELTAGEVQIPVLLLQPLIENAVKHGIAPRKEGGRIELNVHRAGHRIRAQIRDNGVGPLAAPTNGSKTALENCASRIKLRYGADCDFNFVRDQQWTKATIEIPVRGLT